MAMPRKLIGTATDRALHRMLPYAYGSLQECLDAPEVTVEIGRSYERDDGTEVSDDGWVSLNTFHYLRRRVEYNHMLTMSLALHLSRHGDRLVEINEFAVRMDDGDNPSQEKPEITYTYNYENVLADEFQAIGFTRGGADFAIIQLNTYPSAFALTEPKVFEVTTDETSDLLYDCQQWSFGHDIRLTDGTELPGMDAALPRDVWTDADGHAHTTHAWDKEGGSHNGWIEYGGMYVTLPPLQWRKSPEGAWGPVCPQCTEPTVCEVYPPHAS